MTQLRIKELLGRANLILDKGFHILPGSVIVKSAEMEAILDRIDASIPEDIKEEFISLILENKEYYIETVKGWLEKAKKEYFANYGR